MYIIKKYKSINMRNNKVRLTESQLDQVIKESVKRVLNEEIDIHDAQT